MSKPVTRHVAAVVVTILAVLATAAGCSSETEDADTTTTTIWAGTVRTTAKPTTTITTPPDAPQGTETEADYANAFIAAYQTGPDPRFVGIDIACVAPKWVTALGVETFFATGITPARIAGNEASLKDLVGDEDTAGKVVDAVAECGLPLVDLYIGALGADVAADPAKASCIRAAVDADQARAALVAAIGGGEDAVSADPASSCLG